MKQIHYSVLIIVMSMLNIGCAHQRDGGGLDLAVREVKMDSWLNLMPGGPGTFHIAGEIKLRNEESCEVRNLQLSNITVAQLDKKLYSFAPAFTPKIENGDSVIPPGIEKDFLFNTNSGLPINKELDINLPIKLIMLFREDDNSFLYEVENIKVEKVY